MNGTRPLGIWQAGMVIGLRSIWREPLLGLKRLVLPASYWRTAEFAYVWRQLACPPGARILDLGSPKELAFMLARHRGYEVVATDILPDAVALARRYAVAQRMEGRSGGQVWGEVQDGRALSYPDQSFDAAYSVSVLEHIPDRGDSAAIRELVRVVKPGGVVVVTTPYDGRYRETFVRGPVYERQPVGSESIFFERHYDDAALDERLLRPARRGSGEGGGGGVVNLEIWGEGRVPVENLLLRLGPLRLPLSGFECLLAAISLRQIAPGNAGRPMAAFFTLRKTP